MDTGLLKLKRRNGGLVLHWVSSGKPLCGKPFPRTRRGRWVDAEMHADAIMCEQCQSAKEGLTS